MKGHEGDDIISNVSAIANMEGGHLVIGVEDNTLNITGITDFHNYTPDNIVLKILEQTPNLSSEGFFVEQFTTIDTNKTVWVFHVPKTPAPKTGFGPQQTLATC
ncbi:MAG: ATP-binding protein [Prolixibacteraceae bacterium]|nr:ATP-binding protein [Prolixibacteraceae bacterium]